MGTSPVKMAQFKGKNSPTYCEGSWTEPEMFGKKITNGVWAPSEIDALRAAAKQHGMVLVAGGAQRVNDQERG